MLLVLMCTCTLCPAQTPTYKACNNFSCFLFFSIIHHETQHPAGKTDLVSVHALLYIYIFSLQFQWQLKCFFPLLIMFRMPIITLAVVHLILIQLRAPLLKRMLSEDRLELLYPVEPLLLTCMCTTNICSSLFYFALILSLMIACSL